jgi:hypothetical protein
MNLRVFPMAFTKEYTSPATRPAATPQYHKNSGNVTVQQRISKIILEGMLQVIRIESGQGA